MQNFVSEPVASKQPLRLEYNLKLLKQPTEAMSYQYDDVGGMVMDLYGRVDKLRFI